VSSEEGNFKTERWTQRMVTDFFTQLKTINNRCLNIPDLDLGNRTLNDYLAANENKGCVLIFQDGNLTPDVTLDDVPNGIYLAERCRHVSFLM
jgi:hypothetical protein